MASSASAAEQPPQRRQLEEVKRHRSIFEVPPDFFDACRLLPSPSSSLPDVSGLVIGNPPNDVVGELGTNQEIHEDKNNIHGNSNGESSNQNTAVSIMQRWSCSTCKAEFESLQDQRTHFKSDIHRFNIKLSIAGKGIIKEEDFDETISNSLCKDYDISSISGSEDEDDRETSPLHDRQHEFMGFSKNKIFIQLQNGERVSVWKCLLLHETENISFEYDNPAALDGGGSKSELTQREVIEKLKYITHEPRNGTGLRIVLLARGGHFAGCVFDGNSITAHKTFHRYVVRAKAGKKQSSKDAGGRTIHSAGASLRRHNELGLKRDIQELLAAWKLHFSVSCCIFIYAPSNNRQLFFDGDKPNFVCDRRAIQSIPLVVRRPTFKEAKRIYNLLTQISPANDEESIPNIKDEALSSTNIASSVCPEFSKVEMDEISRCNTPTEAHSDAVKIDNVSVSSESEKESNPTGVTTPLHEAAKSGNAQNVLELLEQGLDPCVKDERGKTPYMLAGDKEVRNTFRRFMALNLCKWDWHAANVPSPLTKDMEESQAAKQAEKDAKRKARAKELKKLRRAREKKAQAEAAAQSSSTSKNLGTTSVLSHKRDSQSHSAITSKEEELKRIQDEREKRAAAAEGRIAALKAQAGGSTTSSSNATTTDILCSCCNVSLAGKVPFHRYNYKYCSSSCMHVHREILEDG